MSKLLTQEQLDAALAEQSLSQKSLGRILIDSRQVSEGDLVSVLAGQLGLEFVDLDAASIDASAAGLISDALARRYQALPIGWEDGKLVVAMADPGNVFAIDDIRTITKSEVRVVVTTPAAVLAAIDKIHRMDGDAADISAQAASEFDVDEDLSNIRTVTEERPSSSWSTCSSPRRCTTGRRTSTSSRPSATCGSGIASTACSTR